MYRIFSIFLTIPCFIFSSSASLLQELLKEENLPLEQVHASWIEKLDSFIEENHNAPSPLYPEEHDHPIFHFSKKDCRDFLSALLKRDYDIEHLFLPDPIIYRDDHRTTPISLLQDINVKKETFRVAQIAAEKTKGGIVFVLGQTPAYLGIMLEQLVDPSTNVIFVPFSGRPNYQKMPKYKKTWDLSFFDLLTRDRELIFRSLLEERGFFPVDQKLFIIDESTGASIGCFADLLKRWYYEENHTFPSLTYLPMGNRPMQKNEKGKWISVAYDFAIDEMNSIALPIDPLEMDDEIITLFDKVYDNVRIVPSFHSLQWQPSYIKQVFPLYPTADARQLIEDYLFYLRVCLSST